jgi:hypothetical protein
LFAPNYKLGSNFRRAKGPAQGGHPSRATNNARGWFPRNTEEEEAHHRQNRPNFKERVSSEQNVARLKHPPKRKSGQTASSPALFVVRGRSPAEGNGMHVPPQHAATASWRQGKPPSRQLSGLQTRKEEMQKKKDYNGKSGTAAGGSSRFRHNGTQGSYGFTPT